jgi:hypothetical protein
MRSVCLVGALLLLLAGCETYACYQTIPEHNGPGRSRIGEPDGPAPLPPAEAVSRGQVADTSALAANDGR